MKLRPLSDHIIIEVDEKIKEVGGILLPENAQEDALTGTVLAIGPGALDDNGVLHQIEVKVGDRIAFADWGFRKAKIDGQEYIIADENAVYAIIEEKAECNSGKAPI